MMRLCSIVLFFLYSCGDYKALADIEKEREKNREEQKKTLKDIDRQAQESLDRIKQDKKNFDEQMKKRQEQIEKKSEEIQKLYNELNKLNDDNDDTVDYAQLQKELSKKKTLTKEEEEQLKKINKKLSEYEKTYTDILKKIAEA